ncbi:hypothetical protein DFP72DRAFT_908830 [Ephemerocybe angulata]|uniref:Secreted protein n=1 Tax=Ephemerocybe angulata TaxID=980116 RepID=A0A8H6M3J9_9AGAR|nr:hypothetical protein DFP72DRAFT_908830 [Tulosesus angulatus]
MSAVPPIGIANALLLLAGAPLPCGADGEEDVVVCEALRWGEERGGVEMAHGDPSRCAMWEEERCVGMLCRVRCTI